MTSIIDIKFFFLWLAVSPFFIANVFAQNNQYRLGTGDVLEITVLGEKEFSGKFRIRTDGSIDYPYLRLISVADKTSEQVDELLTQMLKQGYFSDPQVSVEIADYESQRVLLLGAVAKPGAYVLKEQSRLLDIISLAGGILKAGAKQIVLLRTNDQVATASKQEQKQAIPALEGVANSAVNPPNNVAQQKTAEIKNDTENVKKTTIKPKEEKMDHQPGTEALNTTPSSPVLPLPMNENKKDSLDLHAVSYVKPMILNYYGLVHQGDLSQNVVLQNGDIINVPKADEVFVLGHVANPGPVNFEENMTILQAVTLSGGPTALASTRSTYILRQSTTGEEKVEVRLDKILNNKEKNVVLKSNDVIVIPESFF